MKAQWSAATQEWDYEDGLGTIECGECGGSIEYGYEYQADEHDIGVNEGYTIGLTGAVSSCECGYTDSDLEEVFMDLSRMMFDSLVNSE